MTTITWVHLLPILHLIQPFWKHDEPFLLQERQQQHDSPHFQHEHEPILIQPQTQFEGQVHGQYELGPDVRRAIALVDPISTEIQSTFNGSSDRSSGHLLSHLLHEEWKDSIYCWCFQLYPTCIWSIFCPCVLAGEVAETIHWKKSISIIFCFLFIVGMIIVFICFTKSMGLILFIFLLLFALAFQLRNNLRRLLRLPGGPCSDCLLSCCCPWCVIAQAARHVFIFQSTCACHSWRVTEPPSPLPVANVDMVPIGVCSVEVISSPSYTRNDVVRSSSPLPPPPLLMESEAIPHAYSVSNYSQSPPPSSSYSYNRISR